MQAEHGGMKMTSGEILAAIVCYSSPEAKYGPLAVRNGHGQILEKVLQGTTLYPVQTVHVTMEMVEKRVP